MLLDVEPVLGGDGARLGALVDARLCMHRFEREAAARRFCDANRLPNSTVPDVRAVLEEALRRNEIEIREFQDELSPLFREKRAPTLADLAA